LAKRFLHIVLTALLSSLVLSGVAAASDDKDGDGLPDELEQLLLEKFRPTFILSDSECDVAPAQFRAGSQTPIVLQRNGTIYGQVFGPHAGAEPASSEQVLEIHYYHLWSRDCGRLGHMLDVEHVAVLVSAENLEKSITEWQAKYWYAAAHEDTVCAASRWMSAQTINATNSGAQVWISAGKHASYLTLEKCAGGCGGDRCGGGLTLASSLPVINIGEVAAPLNAALWTESAAWVLKVKMKSDFPQEVLAKLAAADTVTAGEWREVQGTIARSASIMNAVIASNRQTGAALAGAHAETTRSLGVSFRATTNSLKRSIVATRNFLRLRARE
jgi:hypothetical protein